MSENSLIEDPDQKINENTSYYLAEAMFPGLVLPDYGGISTKLEAKHYAAVQATTELGEAIIKHISKLKTLQKNYHDNKNKYIKTTDKQINLNWSNFIKSLKKIKKDLFKTNLKNYIRELKKVRSPFYRQKSKYDIEINKQKKKDLDKYYLDVHAIKILMSGEILKHYRKHVKNQLTHGVSIKGQGRKEATGIQVAHKTGNPLKEHKRSKWQRITGQNKEPSVGEIKNG